MDEEEFVLYDPNWYNWREYHQLLDKAIKYEKIGDLAMAMDTYEQIIDNYVPFGVEYYERPARIFEKFGEHEVALYVCRMAILNHIECEDETIRNQAFNLFDPWIKSLAKILGIDENIAWSFLNE